VASDYDFIETIRIKYDREEISLLRSILEEGVKKGVFRVKEPEIASIGIFTALKGLEIPMFWSNQKKDAENQLEELLNLLFYGIMKV
jgi:hypothetical protein